MFGSNGQAKKQLHFWLMPNSGFQTRKDLEPDIREFEAKHPGVEVKLTIHPWSVAWNRIMDVLKGRYPYPNPDVLQLGTTWVATLASVDALEKVPDASVLPNEDKQSAYIWDPGSQSESDQDLYCVPWFIDVRVLYYRKDILDQLGLNTDLLQDWKGLFRACLAIKKYLSKAGPMPRIIAPLGIPGQKPAVLMHDLAPWIWASGGDFCSEDLTEATLNSQESIRGCEFYFDLLNQGLMDIPDDTFDQRRLGCGFFSGHYAMQFSGMWPIDTFFNRTNSLSYADVIDGFNVALFPSGPQGRYTFLGGSNLGVFAQSKEKALSWEFIKFLSEPERQLRHARAFGALTARMASMEPLFENFPFAKKIFWDSLGHARRLPRIVALGSLEQIVYNMGLKILSHIRRGTYNHRCLYDEITAANNSMNSVLSLHRYESVMGRKS